MLEHFYFGIIKNVVSGFGTLFNDVYVARYAADGSEIHRIKVPISYAPKQKFITRQKQSDSDLIHNVEMTLPRMGFEITNLAYDPERKLATTQMTITQTPASGYSRSQLEKVPYNLSFNLHILTKTTEDSLQIIEQIVPYFGPDFVITFRSFGLDQKMDVPIQIGSISISEPYEGDFEERKTFMTTIQFVAKLYLYGPIRNSKVITQTISNFVNFDTLFVSGSTGTPDGYSIVTYGITGATFATVQLTVTGGATAGSLGVTGNIEKIITEYPSEA